MKYFKSAKGKILLSSKHDVITLFFFLLSLLLHIAVIFDLSLTIK